MLFFHQGQRDGGAAIATSRIGEFKTRRAIAGPMDGLRAFFIGEGVNFDFARHHEGAVEAETKVTDDLLIAGGLVLLNEFFGAGEGDLVNILLNLIGGHPDPGVADGEGFVIFIDRQGDLHVPWLLSVLTRSRHHAELFHGIDRIRD